MSDIAISQRGARSSGLKPRKLPRPVEWASSFAGHAPQLKGRIPGPHSLALRERCLRGEFGSYPWVDQVPIAFESGQGVTLTDADDNLFIDLTHGHLGAALGHANPEIIEAVHRQISRLSSPVTKTSAQRTSSVAKIGSADSPPSCRQPKPRKSPASRHSAMLSRASVVEATRHGVEAVVLA